MYNSQVGLTQTKIIRNSYNIAYSIYNQVILSSFLFPE